MQRDTEEKNFFKIDSKNIIISNHYCLVPPLKIELKSY